MSESKMREEFEAWHERTLALLIGTKQHASARKMRNHKDLALLAWQASREALVIELPNVAKHYAHSPYRVAVDDCRYAINAAGLKVKS